MPTRSEFASLELLAAHGVESAGARLADDAASAVAAAEELGFPVVAKLCGDGIAHKTERGLVRLGLRDAAAVEAAATELLGEATPGDGRVSVLVAQMVHGARELIVGVTVDDQFGPAIMLGVGGVFAEAIADVTFRLLPLDARDAGEMIEDLRTQAILGAFRGEPAVDRAALADTLQCVADAAGAVEDLESIDVNPLVVVDGRPVAVDALVVTR